MEKIVQDLCVSEIVFNGNYLLNYTRKISHLVASLPTSRQQVVFAQLVPSCQQVWNILLALMKIRAYGSKALQ
jgi:hypothetical protein